MLYDHAYLKKNDFFKIIISSCKFKQLLQKTENIKYLQYNEQLYSSIGFKLIKKHRIHITFYVLRRIFVAILLASCKFMQMKYLENSVTVHEFDYNPLSVLAHIMGKM